MSIYTSSEDNLSDISGRSFEPYLSDISQGMDERGASGPEFHDPQDNDNGNFNTIDNEEEGDGPDAENFDELELMDDARSSFEIIVEMDQTREQDDDGEQYKTDLDNYNSDKDNENQNERGSDNYMNDTEIMKAKTERRDSRLELYIHYNQDQIQAANTLLRAWDTALDKYPKSALVITKYIASICSAKSFKVVHVLPLQPLFESMITQLKTFGNQQTSKAKSRKYFSHLLTSIVDALRGLSMHEMKRREIIAFQKARIVKKVVRAMIIMQVSRELITHGFSFLANLAHENKHNRDILMKAGALDEVIEAMRNHAVDEKLQLRGCLFLRNITSKYIPTNTTTGTSKSQEIESNSAVYDFELHDEIVASAGIETIYTAMSSFPKSNVLQIQGLMACYHLMETSRHGPCRRGALFPMGIVALKNLWREIIWPSSEALENIDQVIVLPCILTVLANICEHGANAIKDTENWTQHLHDPCNPEPCADLIASKDGLQVMEETLKKFATKEVVLLPLLHLLKCLSRSSLVQKALHNNGGFKLILMSFDKVVYSRNKEALICYANIVSALASDEENRNALGKYGAVDRIMKIIKNFEGDPECSVPVIGALNRLTLHNNHNAEIAAKNQVVTLVFSCLSDDEQDPQFIADVLHLLYSLVNTEKGLSQVKSDDVDLERIAKIKRHIDPQNKELMDIYATLVGVNNDCRSIDVLLKSLSANDGHYVNDDSRQKSRKSRRATEIDGKRSPPHFPNLTLKRYSSMSPPESSDNLSSSFKRWPSKNAKKPELSPRGGKTSPRGKGEGIPSPSKGRPPTTPRGKGGENFSSPPGSGSPPLSGDVKKVQSLTCDSSRSRALNSRPKDEASIYASFRNEESLKKKGSEKNMAQKFLPNLRNKVVDGSVHSLSSREDSKTDKLEKDYAASKTKKKNGSSTGKLMKFLSLNNKDAPSKELFSNK